MGRTSDDRSKQSRWTPLVRARGLADAVAIVALVAACDKAACVTPPCPEFPAVLVTVRSPDSTIISGLHVAYSGAASGAGDCQQSSPGICEVIGPRGDYDVTVSAPGYASAEKTFSVSGNAPQECGCTIVTTQNWDVTLVKQS